MNLQRLDTLLERGADALENLARDLARDGGFKRQVAEQLMEDAAFLRQLTPTKVVARARGEAPTDTSPEEVTQVVKPLPEERPKPQAPKGPGGVNPFVVVGIAFAVGIALGKLIDWRGHAHPRR